MAVKNHTLLALAAVAIAAGSLLGFVSATPAFAASPWWHLSSGSRPGYLPVGGTAIDEVQELSVSATSGDFYLENSSNEKSDLAPLVPPPSGVGPPLPFNATHEEVQSTLEGLYGEGNVEVTGGPVGKPAKVEDQPYVIKFLNAGPVKLVQAESFPFSDEPEFPEGSGEKISLSPLEIETSPGVKVGGSIQAREVTSGSLHGSEVVVMASNLGDEATGTTPVTITDKLPPGLKAVAIEGVAGEKLPGDGNRGPVECSFRSLSCTFTGTLPPYDLIEVLVSVVVEPGANAEEANEASISGGGASSATVRRALSLGSGATPFGVQNYELTPEEEGGAPDTQAGSHPFQLTTTLTLNQTADGKPIALPKDLRFKLPPGLIGNPSPFPQCTIAQFLTKNGLGDECAPRTALGVAMVNTNATPYLYVNTFTVPLFNLEPAVGEPARFGFLIRGTPVILDTSVRTGGDYGVTVSVDNITQTAAFLGSQVTFWGVPGDPRHDAMRGWGCLAIARGEAGTPGYPPPTCNPLEQDDPPPFLSLPTSCTGPLQTSVEADSWVQPGDSPPYPSSEPLPSLDGCNRLQFSPTISVKPGGQAASTPTGLTIGVHVPQDVSLDAGALAEGDVKDTTVTLPTGVQLSPSAGDGLQACTGNPGAQPGSPGNEIGFTGVAELNKETEPGVQTPQFNPAEPSCPEASKVATVTIKTPLLPAGQYLNGFVYLASPQNFAGLAQNPFESLVAMYIVAEDPVSGVLVKLAGRVSPDPVTGQLTATFEDTPQLPFENLELEFFGGERAPLSTPASCGTYTTTTSITPWSGNVLATPSSSFAITTGPDGSGLSGCSSPRQFAPGFNAQTTNIQAGAFTPFTLTMSRPDQDQTLGRIEMTMPPGLSGTLSNVKLCPEPQASQGTCGPESLVGETVVSAGLGGDPYTVTGGKVYITTGYNGAPYGLSIVNPAAAGPFVLDEGRPVIVRASVYVDPHTAALKIVSDPLPTILDGIPLQIQHVNVTINGAGGNLNRFTFNPTSCNKMAVNGTLFSSEGAPAAASTPFQVTDCEKLAFKPKFTASTSGKTSKTDGASLSVKIAYPNTPQGTEVNIAKVKVDLPKQLPSRLTTLQKACLAKVFEANPANCPKDSEVGHAKAITPILPVPLEGPAYFVSHGGEAFPSLIVVLKGYGVTVDLVGTTFISKAGITSSTFKSVPDVPVSSFELTLPEGKYSALGTNKNLCTQKLAMPTAFVAQNGAEIHESTPVGVTGCKKAKKAKKSTKKKGKHKTGKGKQGKNQ